MAAGLLLGTVLPADATASPMRRAVAAYNRQAYVVAAAYFMPLAERGDPRAETYLGFMYATGRGVPQNYEMSAWWYRRAAEQGEPTAQYRLGLMYDKGQGVPQDYVEAYVLVDLAVAAAPSRERDYWARIRDAIGQKLTLSERTRAQRRATLWRPPIP